MARFVDHTIKGGGQLPPGAAAPTPPPTGNTFTVDPAVVRSGNVYSFTARRSGTIAAAETHQYAVAGSSINGVAAAASDFGGAFPTVTTAFAAGAATAQFQITSPIAQPR